MMKLGFTLLALFSGTRSICRASDLRVVSGQDPVLVLEQDNSYQRGEHTWRIGANEQGFFISGDPNAKPLEVAVDGPTHTLHLSADGFLGLGTGRPSKKLHVRGDALIEGTLQSETIDEMQNEIEMYKTAFELAVHRIGDLGRRIEHLKAARSNKLAPTPAEMPSISPSHAPTPKPKKGHRELA